MWTFLPIILPYFCLLTVRKLLLQYLISIYCKCKVRHISERSRLIQTELSKWKRLYFRERLLRLLIPLFILTMQLKLTRTQKHLGLQLDSKLSFNEHTNSKISKVTKDIGLLRKLQHILRRCLLIVYKYFVRCHLDFGDIIYDPPSNASFSNKIESVQFNAALAITRVIKGTSIDNLYQELRLGYLQQRRWIRKFCLHYEFILSEQLAHIYKLLSQREILIDTPILSMHFFVELYTSKFHFSICH